MHVTYRYVLEKCQELCPSLQGNILDYGCGAGEIVEAGQKHGFKIYGVEEFYEGGSGNRERLREKGLLGHVVKDIDDGHIPFPDGYFDLVISNQVFEHVVDLHAVLKEIHRVMKPTGRLLCLFPSRDVIREGHCGVPIIHWFPKNKHYRYYWLLLFRNLGFGYHKDKKSTQRWSIEFLDWLDKFTFYRSSKEIHSTFLNIFSSLCHIEEDYISYRLDDKNLWIVSLGARMMPFKYLSRWFCRKFAGIVIIATKN